MDRENEQREKKEMARVNNRKNKVRVVKVQTTNSLVPMLLIIIIMILCLFAGYFISEKELLNFNKGNNETEVNNTNNDEVKNDNNTGTIKQPVVTNYSVTDEKVANLIDNLLSVGDCNNALQTYVNNQKIESKNISNLAAYHIAEKDMQSRNSFTLDEFQVVIKKYLGKDYSFNPNTINYTGESCPMFIYDNNTKTFSKSPGGCGGECSPTAEYKMYKAVDTDGVLEIDIRVIFYGSYGYGTFSDYGRTQNISATSKDLLFEKGGKYKFTFKLENGHYVFVASQPSN